jgi:2-oxoglutarate dehydrogenase E1 component
MQIVNCSTAANYFHVLRRQLIRPFRKPLVVIAPKKLLKLREAGSDLEDFAKGNNFKRIIGETNKSISPSNVRKVVFYYDLVAEREKLGKKDIAIVRVEQLSPFPFAQLTDQLNLYKNAEITWSQEEHKNAGPWTFIEPRIRATLKHIGHKSREVSYAGRELSASTATGYGAQHAAELKALLADAMK